MPTMTSTDALAALELANGKVTAASNRLDRVREEQARGAASALDVARSKKELAQATDAAELAGAAARLVRRMESDEARERQELAERLKAAQQRSAVVNYTRLCKRAERVIGQMVADLADLGDGFEAVETTLGRGTAGYPHRTAAWAAVTRALPAILPELGFEQKRFVVSYNLPAIEETPND